MRNAPIVWALHQRIKKGVQIFVGMDERAHSFRALGRSKASGHPSVLVCTSGTAAANYFPAVIEAKKSHVPLIILSCDRPEELASNDANQSINQIHLFGQFTQENLNIMGPNPLYPLKALASSLCHIFSRACGPVGAPVHINVRFREPLDHSLENIPANVVKDATYICNKERPFLEVKNLKNSLDQSLVDDMVQRLTLAQSALVVVGHLGPRQDDQSIKNLLLLLNWPTILDISSSLKFDRDLHHLSIPNFDHPEVFHYFKNHPPEIIIHLGGRLTSKHYYRYLEQAEENQVISVNNNWDHEDPAHATHFRLVTEIGPLAKMLYQKLDDLKLQSCRPQELTRFAQQKREIIERGPLSYPFISKSMAENGHQNIPLFIGNSTIIRSFDNYIPDQFATSFPVLTNRGASGIEGLLASACGMCDFYQTLAVVVLGDVSLFHDLNSLHTLSGLASPLIVVVINNKGGGIFKLLPIAQDENLLPYLSTPHHIEFKKACELFNIFHVQVETKEEFLQNYQSLLKAGRTAMIEVMADDRDNLEVYHQLRTIGQ